MGPHVGIRSVLLLSLASLSFSGTVAAFGLNLNAPTPLSFGPGLRLRGTSARGHGEVSCPQSRLRSGVFSDRRSKVVGMMAAKDDDLENRIAAAEEALDDAVASSDPNAIAKAAKQLEKLQGQAGGAGAKTFNKKSMSKEEEKKRISELLGYETEAPAEAAEEIADALEEGEEEAREVAIEAARRAVEDAVKDNDVDGLARAIKQVETLLGTEAGGESFDDASVQGEDVKKDLAIALEKAAVEAGDYADAEELIEDGADKEVRVAAAESLIADAIADNDVMALQNGLVTLEKLLGADAGDKPLDDANVDGEAALKAAMGGAASPGSAEAMGDIAKALADAEAEDEGVDYGQDGPSADPLDDISDPTLKLAAAEAMVEEAVASNDAEQLLGALEVLQSLEDGAASFDAKSVSDADAASILKAAGSSGGMKAEEVLELAAALGEAEAEGDDGVAVDDSVDAEVAAKLLEDAVESNDEEAVEDALAALAKVGGASGDSPADKTDAGSLKEILGDNEDVAKEVAEALAAEEEDQELDDLSDLLEDDEDLDDVENVKDEDEEDEDQDWKEKVVTGWEAGEEGGGGASAAAGEKSWVELARELAEAEAARLDLQVVDARWTNGKLLFKVDHMDPEEKSVGIEECETLSRSLGDRLEVADFMEDRPYNLVVSTPGAKEVLTREREFTSFKGFPIVLTTTEPFKKKTEFQGTLHDRTEEVVRVNMKGRIVDVPRPIVKEVRLVQDQTSMS